MERAGTKEASVPPKAARTWDGELLVSPDHPPPVTIYGLCHLKTREVFYIGQSVSPVSRWSAHRKMTGHPATCAMFVLAVVPEVEADAVEAGWIAAYQEAGAILMNVMRTQGGHHSRKLRDHKAWAASKRSLAWKMKYLHTNKTE